jgi:DNA-directed RNA polymerase subunit RPC12/RpoP
MVKFFCTRCGKQIWEKMPDYIKETTTIAEAERTSICSDCSYLEYLLNNKEGG